MNESLRIGVTRGPDPERLSNYASWLTSTSVNVEVVDLAAGMDPESLLNTVHGVLLSGGSDVDPTMYNRPEDVALCTGIDHDRDQRETLIYRQAQLRGIPVLGICRGLQLINVLEGGTLMPHLPEKVPGSELHAKHDGRDGVHDVSVNPGTLLFKGILELEGEVNTAHHQAVDQLAEGLVVSARSPDGVIEAIEPLDPAGKPYLLAVQWHPERMADPSSPFARGVLDQFLFEATSRRMY